MCLHVRKTSDPRDGAFYDPSAIICTILVKAYCMKLHAKDPKPGPSNFTQEDLCFPIWAYVKQVTREPSYFWPLGFDMNNLGRGLSDKAMYQISKVWAF